MKLLEDRILSSGVVGKGNVLKVDAFLNHQIDVPFTSLLGKEIYERYKDCAINKILTVEASGIGIACLTAQFFQCPVVFAKKSKTINLSGDVFTASAFSYTHGYNNILMVNKAFLSAADTVLLIDDFLANGEALEALIEICEQAGCDVAGAGILVEKSYQPGRDRIEARGVRIESLARIASMSPDGEISFISDGK